MKKFLSYYVLPITMLVLFILFMNSGNYYKSPRGTSDDFEGHLRQVQQQVLTSNWKQAQRDFPLLSASWSEIIPRIQYSVEKDEINSINVNLARLHAYLDLHDPKNALAEINEAREHWDHLNN